MITRKVVQGLLDAIVEKTGAPKASWTKTDNGYVANVGALYLDYNAAYGRYAVEKIVNDAGGVTRIWGRGGSKEVYAFLRGWLHGLENA
jgi:hypothetical protein